MVLTTPARAQAPMVGPGGFARTVSSAKNLHAVTLFKVSELPINVVLLAGQSIATGA